MALGFLCQAASTQVQGASTALERSLTGTWTTTSTIQGTAAGLGRERPGTSASAQAATATGSTARAYLVTGASRQSQTVQAATQRDMSFSSQDGITQSVGAQLTRTRYLSSASAQVQGLELAFWGAASQQAQNATGSCARTVIGAWTAGQSESAEAQFLRQVSAFSQAAQAQNAAAALVRFSGDPSIYIAYVPASSNLGSVGANAFFAYVPASSNLGSVGANAFSSSVVLTPVRVMVPA